MMMSKAFLDSTIITDCLLKKGSKKEHAACAALEKFELTELPVYAIKEFKSGPLQHYAFLHNTLAKTNNLAETYEAISSLPPLMARKRRTALEALAMAEREVEAYTNAQFVDTYGSLAHPACVLTDLMRNAVKKRIFLAWRARRKLTNRVVDPLFCYGEEEPRTVRGLIQLSPRNCHVEHGCAIAMLMRDSPDDARALMEMSDQADTSEDSRRASALGTVLKERKSVDDSTCRSLGDAVYAFCAPRDAVILTTNTRDHGPLAEALGKRAVSPKDLAEDIT